MSFRTSVTIVASPRPRVGKTLLARLLTDFHRHEGRPLAAYDLNDSDGTLRDFLPKTAQPAHIADIKGQVALFDSLVADDDVTRVVDLGHATFTDFFALAEHIGFVEEALGRGVAPVVLYMLTPDRTSIEAYRDLRRRFPDMTVVPVHNDMFGLTQHRDRYALTAYETVLRLPVLAPSLRRYVERPPFSFADVTRARDMPPDALDEVNHWLRRIYLSFRELYLRVLLTELRAAISLGT